MKKNTLVIHKLNIFTLAIAAILRITKWFVFYYEISPKVKQLEKYNILKTLNVCAIDFENCHKLNTSLLEGDISGIQERVTDAIFPKPLLEASTYFFPGISNTERKLFILFRQTVDTSCFHLKNILAWLDERNEHSNIFLLGPYTSIHKHLIRETPTNSKLALPITITTLLLIITETFNLVFSKAISKNKFNTANSDEIYGRINEQDITKYETLYFPHQSILYGDSFVKNQFYSNIQSSPLHPSNILHIELQEIPAYVNKGKLSELHKKLGINYFIIEKPSYKELTKYVFKAFLKALALPQIMHYALNSPAGFLILIIMSAKFNMYKDRMKRFKNAKIALVGYDILFPKTLALALESMGIKTIATQERFISTRYNDYNFIVHSYLCSSNETAKYLSRCRFKHAEHYIPVGLPRTDLLLQISNASKETSPSPFSVLVLDFHSCNDDFFNRSRPFVNRKVNKDFYLDIIRLATDNPHATFTIRSKDSSWIQMDYFSDIIETIQSMRNIVIDNNPTETFRPYILASACHTVIAKHTSLADECICLGKNVIIHDFQFNSDSFISNIYDYDGLLHFAHNYKQLSDLFLRSCRGTLYNKDSMSRLQNIINNGPADGNVISTIQQKIHSILITN